MNVIFLFRDQMGSIVICVSPFVSLMMDQKAQFYYRVYGRAEIKNA